MKFLITSFGVRTCDESLGGCGKQFDIYGRYGRLCPKCLQRIRYGNLKPYRNPISVKNSNSLMNVQLNPQGGINVRKK